MNGQVSSMLFQNQKSSYWVIIIILWIILQTSDWSPASNINSFTSKLAKKHCLSQTDLTLDYPKIKIHTDDMPKTMTKPFEYVFWIKMYGNISILYEQKYLLMRTMYLHDILVLRMKNTIKIDLNEF